MAFAWQEVVASSETGLSEMAKLLEGQERRTFNLGEVPWCGGRSWWQEQFLKHLFNLILQIPSV